MYLASIDCGTTNSRVYIIDENGEITGKGVRKVGVRDTSMTGSKDALKNGLKEAFLEAVDNAGLTLADISFAVSAGMITSEIGLYEIPHLWVPAGPEELANGITKVHDLDVFPVDVPIYFIPGIKNKFDPANTKPEQVGMLDFMRGEEAQVAGILAGFDIELPFTMVILSSHTKFISIGKDGKVLSSLTTMSGQVYEAIKKETFLGKSIEAPEGEKEPEGYFDPAVIDYGFKWVESGGFLRSLMMTRFLDVLLKTSWYERKLFVESLIASEDMHSLNQFDEMGLPKDANIVLVGHKGRCRIYDHILKNKMNWKGNVKSITDVTEIDMLNIKGSLDVLKRAGIL